MCNLLHRKLTILKLGYLLYLPLLAGCSSVPMSTEESLFQKKYGHFSYCRLEATKQSRSDSCGSACLVSVLKYWGVGVMEQKILAEFPTLPKGGYSIAKLKHIARTKGLETFALTMRQNPIEQLREQIFKGRPVICAVFFPRDPYFAYDVPVIGQIYRNWAWMYGPRKNHYVVVFGIRYDTFLIMDPAYGLTTLKTNRFLGCWGQKQYATVLCGRKSKWYQRTIKGNRGL